jgi:sigma-B regulation protein RsbU (phosphoserine phosphatase)
MVETPLEPSPPLVPDGPAGDLLRMLVAAMQQVAEGVVVVDPKGRFLLWNEAARRIVGMGPLGTSPAEWSSAYGCFLPDGVTPYPSEQLPLTRAMRGERVREAGMFVRNPSNPEGSWISINSAPLRDTKGELVGGVIVFRDVTARREADEVVRRLSRAVEKTTDAVFITDRNAVIEYVNPAFVAVTGYTEEEALGKRPSILKSGRAEPGYYEALWKRILSGNVHRGTLVNRKKNGELFHAEQTITPVSDEAGRITHFVSVMRDVTALKKAHAREVEMRLARIVQQRLYPARPPELPGFDLAGATFPTDHTCGDYYDFLPVADGRLGIAVGDVSGHGFGAALLMAETRAYLRSLSKTTADLGEILRQLNLLLYQDTEDERFVTLLLTLLDPERRTIAYASAGHINGYLLDGSGAVRRALDSTGIPLGILGEAKFASSPEIPLAAGDLLLLLTDGAADAEDREGASFETERVLHVVAEARRQSSAEVVGRLRAAVEEFARESPQRDDITVVVCRVTSPP